MLLSGSGGYLPLESHFFESVLEAIIGGFCATFLLFRIQREADYYRNPSQAQPQTNRQQFSSSFLIIILASLMAATFGVVLPLFRLVDPGITWITPKVVVVGLFEAMLLAALYLLCGDGPSLVEIGI
jgi:hypothetical protein